MATIYQTRIIIETTSPMAIYTGNRDTGFDNQLARDASGLPYIPASSIAGVWRSLVRNNLENVSDKKWFGFTDNNQNSDEHSSRLIISNGIVHNSNNKPVIGLQTQEMINNDAILALLSQNKPLHRERVAINDRGVASDKGKFDQLLIPTGVRFCIDIRFSDQYLTQEDIKQWSLILACWQQRSFCLGASTRNGLGQFILVGLYKSNVNLDLEEEVTETFEHPSAKLADFNRYNVIPTKVENISVDKKIPFATLPLKALDNWRCGSGSQLLTKTVNQPANVSLISYSEPRITWVKNKAKLSETNIPVLCGSSIKGILAHRVAYHYRKHENQWAETMADHTHEQWQKRPDALAELFGFSDDEHENSLAGKLYVDDCEITYQHTTIRHHNSIDRFTGGVRKGALYTEELLYQPEFTLKLWLAPNTDTELSASLISALKDTLKDLEIGLLPMGAGSGRGTSLVEINDDSKDKWQIDFGQIKEKTSNNTIEDKAKESAHEC